MGFFVLKTVISALIIAGVSELAKRFTPLAALIASLPLMTILTFTWIYLDTRNLALIGTMSREMLWLIVPSALFFVLLPLLLKGGWPFALSMLASTAATVAFSSAVAFLGKR